MSLQSTMNSPYPAPSPTEDGKAAHQISSVDKPEDTSVLHTVFYREGLNPSPAALETPMGTAIPGIGHEASGGDAKRGAALSGPMSDYKK